VKDIFSAPVQTGPGAQPVPCKMGTGSFLGVKSGRGVTLTPQSSSSDEVYPLWATTGPVKGLLYLLPFI